MIYQEHISIKRYALIFFEKIKKYYIIFENPRYIIYICFML